MDFFASFESQMIPSVAFNATPSPAAAAASRSALEHAFMTPAPRASAAAAAAVTTRAPPDALTQITDVLGGIVGAATATEAALAKRRSAKYKCRERTYTEEQLRVAARAILHESRQGTTLSAADAALKYGGNASMTSKLTRVMKEVWAINAGRGYVDKRR